MSTRLEDMQIGKMFEKRIDRNIDAVVVASNADEDVKYQELDEYVVTKEIKRHLDTFFSNYVDSINHPNKEMGVWVSGFFGTGKSHFIKILSYILENIDVKGKEALEFFQEKINDPILLANMKKSADITTDTLLFNIAAEDKSSYGDDSILRIFQKKFYGHMGYYEGDLGIAHLEYYLDKQGLYEKFKEIYEQKAGEPWVGNRNKAVFRNDFIIATLNEVLAKDDPNYGKTIYANKDNEADISIREFADEVKDYIDYKNKDLEQHDDYHIVFLVDEIGQFIGDNNKAMLSLQTIVEELGRSCQGKAWVIVTSQESIDDITQISGDDFSKIQGRFKTRISLSSETADEVIKKRILEKNEEAEAALEADYPNVRVPLNNLLSFEESSGEFRSFNSDKEYAQNYPFVSYQFNLLQRVFDEVRTHSYSGQNLSKGERSMLTVFQQVAVNNQYETYGILIPMYQFYAPMEKELDSSIREVVNRASERNENLKNDDFSIKVLKTLFLVKYIDDLTSNVENITTLMISSIDEDRTTLRKQVEASLRKLVEEQYVLKNGDVYEFLTNDEQDINREIDKINIEPRDLAKQINSYIFDDIYDNKKFRYSEYEDFTYGVQIDSFPMSNKSNQDLQIQVLTSRADDIDETTLKLSASGNKLIIVLGDTNYAEELEEAMKIENYTSRISKTLSESKNRIIDSKRSEARIRKGRTKEYLEEAIKTARFFMQSEDKTDIVRGSKASEKIDSALSYLVENVYYKIDYLKDHVDGERDLIKQINRLKNDQQITMFKDSSNEMALEELENYINNLELKNEQITLAKLEDHFEAKPYGWPKYDTISLVISLYFLDKIKLISQGEKINLRDFNSKNDIKRLTNRNNAEILTIKTVKEVDTNLINKAQSIIRKISGPTSKAQEADKAQEEIQAVIDNILEKLKHYKAEYSKANYPGADVIRAGINFFSQFDLNLDPETYFKKITENEDRLEAWNIKYSNLDNFFSSNQRKIFDEASNLARKYEQRGLGTEIIEKIKAILSMEEPYTEIPNLSIYITQLKQDIKAEIERRKNEGSEKIEALQQSTIDFAEKQDASADLKDEINTKFKDLQAKLTQAENLYLIRRIEETGEKLKDTYLNKFIPKKTVSTNASNSDNNSYKAEISAKEISKTIDLKELYDDQMIETEADIDKFITKLQGELKKILKDNGTFIIKN